jgi:ribonuclease P protein component
LGDGLRLRYPRSARVRSGPEIRALLREGSRRRCGPLEVIRRPSKTRKARAAIVIPLYGQSAVERNRLKRRVREFLRTEWLPLASGEAPAPEILVRARSGAYGLAPARLRETLAECLETP